MTPSEWRATWRIDPAEWRAYEALSAGDYAGAAVAAREALHAYQDNDERRGRMVRLLVLIWREVRDVG